MRRSRQAAGAVLAVVALSAMGQVLLYNWRLSLLLALERTDAMTTVLENEIEELETERALLLAPSRLEAAGESLGLVPLPLERLALVVTEPDESGDEGLAQLR